MTMTSTIPFPIREGSLTKRDLLKNRLLAQKLFGFERGQNQLADVIVQSADGASLTDMWAEFQASIRQLNAQRDPLVSALTYGVTAPTERVLVPSGDVDFEEATENGEPKGMRLGTPYVFGYDFKWYDLAIRYTWLFLAESSSDQITALHSTALEADDRLVFTKVFKAIFNKTNSVAEANQQAVNVYRFYNADGIITPPTYRGKTFSSSHNHYLGANHSGAVVSEDLDTMDDHLYEHGYRLTLGYRLVLMVNRQEGATIRTFKVLSGDKYDFIPTSGVGGGVILPASMGIVGQPGAVVPGQIGTYGPFIVVEEDYIPAGYMFLFATGGENHINNPVGIREHQVASLRGLRLVKGPDGDYPLTDSFYQHGLGAGIRHRGAGVVMQVVNSSTYSTPAAYA
jgi:hypothetical protein